jgi:hypothetical protein
LQRLTGYIQSMRKGKIFIFAIVFSAIAGGLAVASKHYMALTGSRGELRYKTVVSPDQVSGRQHNRHAFLTVTNTGKSPVSGVVATIIPQQGQIESFQMQGQMKMVGTSKYLSGKVLAEVSRLLPGENFTVEIVYDSPKDTTGLGVTVSSNEMTGLRD